MNVWAIAVRSVNGMTNEEEDGILHEWVLNNAQLPPGEEYHVKLTAKYIESIVSVDIWDKDMTHVLKSYILTKNGTLLPEFI